MSDDIDTLRRRLDEAENHLSALRNQEVDAIVGNQSVQLIRLKELEEQYHQLIKNLPDVVFRINKAGEFKYFSPAARLYFEDGEQGFSGKQLQDTPFPEDVVMVFEEKLEILINKGSPVEFNFSIDTQRGFRHLQTRLFPDKEGENGSLSHALGIITDVTEKKKDEKKIINAMQAAERAVAAKTRFLANISHEIRTPLTSILGYADILQERDSREMHEQAVQSIEESGNLLLSIINDVLDLSKMDANKIQINKSLVSPAGIVTDAIRLLQQDADKKGLELRQSELGPIPDKILTDGDKIKQILVNLLSNAIKFTEEGHVELQYHFIRSENLMHFKVRDMGTGIDPEFYDRLFEPFEQEEGGEKPGTGLGLAICQNLAHALEGSLILESNNSNGATFSLTLPVDLSRLDPQPNQNREGPITSFAQARILIIDDDPDARNILSHYVSIWGCSPVLAASGEEALSLLETSPPADFAILDMRMPGMDGLETLAELRSRSFDKPVVALSAHVQSEEIKKYLKAGCCDCLRKPIDRNALRDTLLRQLAEEGRAD